VHSHKSKHCGRTARHGLHATLAGERSARSPWTLRYPPRMTLDWSCAPAQKHTTKTKRAIQPPVMPRVPPVWPQWASRASCAGILHDGARWKGQVASNLQRSGQSKSRRVICGPRTQKPGGGWGVSRCAGAPFLELRCGSRKPQRERPVVHFYVEFGGLEPAITARTWAWTLSWQAGNVHLGRAGLEL
jgi:hypothetical protein